MTSAETGVLKHIFDMLGALIGGYVAQKRNFFEHHVEPLQAKVVGAHSDYIKGFQEIRRHLKDDTQPPSEIIEFMKERRRVYEYERVLARDLALEMEKARRVGINDDLWRAVNNYTGSILRYFSASATLGTFTWYTDFLEGFEDAIRLGFGNVGETVWREAGFSQNPRRKLISTVDTILDHGLPRAFEEVSNSYAAVRARLS